MQLRHLALGVEQDRSGARARGPRLGELSFEFRGAAGEGRIDDVFERQRRGIGHHRDDVLHGDLGAAARIEGELADFIAGGGAVAAEQRDQQSPRVGRQRQAGRAQLIVDQPRAILLAVGIARQRRGILGAFAQIAQRRIAAQIAGLDHHAAFGNAGAEQCFDRRRDVAAAGLQPHGAATAEQRNGQRLLDQPRRIGADVLAFEPRQRERIARIVDRGLDESVDAFADQAGVRAEHQHHRARRIGARDEAVDVRSFDRDHA